MGLGRQPHRDFLNSGREAMHLVRFPAVVTLAAIVPWMR
jgi:hypothetical protein